MCVVAHILESCLDIGFCIAIGDCGLVESSQSPSHSQSVGVLCRHRIVQYSTSSSNLLRIPGPGDSGSSSTSGGTGEGEQKDTSCQL